MNKVTIDRELLEQVASEFEHDNDRYMLGRELRKVLDAPRQPEGEGLEVVGWYHSHAEVATSDKARVVTWLPECIEPLCRLSDAQRAIAELREEISDLHTTMMAAAVEIQEHWQSHCDEEGCGLPEPDFTLDSGAQPCYYAETVQRAIAELAGLLRDARLKIGYMLNYGEWYSPEELLERIDAALAEIQNAQQPTPLTISTADIQSPSNKD